MNLILNSSSSSSVHEMKSILSPEMIHYSFWRMFSFVFIRLKYEEICYLQYYEQPLKIKLLSCLKMNESVHFYRITYFLDSEFFANHFSGRLNRFREVAKLSIQHSIARSIPHSDETLSPIFCNCSLDPV